MSALHEVSASASGSLGVVVSPHNWKGLCELDEMAREAKAVYDIVWHGIRWDETIHIPVGALSCLEIAWSKADEVLSALGTFRGCVDCGSVYNPPFECL